jgi:hypothetical protein
MAERQPDGDPGDEYDPGDEGPEAKMHRERERLLNGFLSTLTPEDAHRHLFTFEEITKWIIKHGRFRHSRRR